MTNDHSDTEMTRLEKQKLELEISELRRPFFSKPTSWLSIAAAIAALGGVVGQSLISSYKVERALYEAQEKQRRADEQVVAAQSKAEKLAQAAQVAISERETAENAVEEARVLGIQLDADHKALREQIEQASRSLGRTEGIVSLLKEASVDPKIIAELEQSLNETSEVLGRSCKKEEAIAYDTALFVDSDNHGPLLKVHFPWGTPASTGPHTDVQKLVQPWWIGGFSPSMKLPIWVGYRMDQESLVSSDRKDCWRPDPRIDKDQMARLEDYRRSGYDRGHLVSRVDVGVSEPAMASTYVFTNLTPQTPNLNRGALLRLERSIRQWAEVYKQLYVIIGPIFDNDGDRVVDSTWTGKTIGESAIPVPTHFFRIILRTTDNGDIETLAFIHPNDADIDRSAPIMVFQVTVRDIERASGLKFFPNIDSITRRKLVDGIGKISNW